MLAVARRIADEEDAHDSVQDVLYPSSMKIAHLITGSFYGFKNNGEFLISFESSSAYGTKETKSGSLNFFRS
ncbi:MAG: hypothetical protein V7701_02115 [Sneathiella sp.]